MHRAQSSHAVRGTPNRVPLWRQAAGCLLLLGVCVASSRAADAPSAIQQVDLVHFSHTDYGFTDHPAVCRELQRRFLDLAIDGVLATRDKPAEARSACRLCYRPYQRVYNVGFRVVCAAEGVARTVAAAK